MHLCRFGAQLAISRTLFNNCHGVNGIILSRKNSSQDQGSQWTDVANITCLATLAISNDKTMLFPSVEDKLLRPVMLARNEPSYDAVVCPVFCHVSVYSR